MKCLSFQFLNLNPMFLWSSNLNSPLYPFLSKIKNKKNHFEGWYLKISNDKQHFILIFGRTTNIIDNHAFIQLYHSSKQQSQYFRFPIHQFRLKKKRQQKKLEIDKIFIKNNFISNQKIFFAEEGIKLQIDVKKTIHLKKYFFSNSAMFFAKYLPISCYQEVIFMNASCDFYFQENEKKNKAIRHIGNLYLENSFGKSFPDKWLWLQCNDFFEQKTMSLSFSYGKISFLGKKINAFFCIFQYNNKEYRFSSYNLSQFKLKEKKFKKENLIQKEKQQYKKYKKLLFLKKNYSLEIIVSVGEIIPLIGPSKNGLMNQKVLESLNTKIKLTLYKKIKNRTYKKVISAIGSHCGFEDML